MCNSSYLKTSLLYFMCPNHVGKLIPFQEGVQGVRAIKQVKVSHKNGCFVVHDSVVCRAAMHHG